MGSAVRSFLLQKMGRKMRKKSTPQTKEEKEEETQGPKRIDSSTPAQVRSFKFLLYLLEKRLPIEHENLLSFSYVSYISAIL